MAINDYLGEKAQTPQRGSQRGISRRSFLASGLGALVAGALPTSIYSAETEKVPSYGEYCRVYIELFGKDEFEKEKDYLKEEWKNSDSNKKSAAYSYTRYAQAYSKAFGKEEFMKKRNELVEKYMHEDPKRRQKAQDFLVSFSEMKVPSLNDFQKALGDRYNPKNEESTKRFWENQEDKSKKIICLIYTKPEEVSSFYFYEIEEKKVKKLGLTDKEIEKYEKVFDGFDFWKIRFNKCDFSSNLLYEMFSRKELK
jgi:hypothetical protein